MSKDTVRIANDDGGFTTIPRAELAPGMVRAHVIGPEGDRGEVWVDPHTLDRQVEFRHPPFGEEVRAIIAGLSDTFQDVLPMSPEEWQDNFRRDCRPARDIGAWRVAQEVFLHFTEGRNLDQDQRRDIFNVVFTCLNNGPENLRYTANPRTVSRRRMREIGDYFAQRLAIHARRWEESGEGPEMVALRQRGEEVFRDTLRDLAR